MKEEKMVYCSGEGCPFKEGCARFKENIDKFTMYHLSRPPLKTKLNTLICTYKIEKDGGRK